MEIFSLVLLVLYLVSTLPVHVVAENAVDASTASTLIKEGQSAEILCMTKGTGDYFWRKGESLLNSSLVASFTGGQVRKDAEPYVVTENGTLIIKIVTLGDEGKYFCRVSSVINECYGELNVFVEASLRSFALSIDRCDRKSSCLLYISPTQSTSLTCTATNASPSMTLKWFNGSKEITEGIEKYDLPTQNGNARDIRSTITAVYGHPASLTCQAVDPKRGNNDVRFAHAQVETTVPVTATLPSWIIVAITLVGCLIVFGIYILIKAMANRTQKKKYKKLKKQRYESLQSKVPDHIQEMSTLKGDVQIKAKAIAELETKLKRRDKENFELQQRVANNEAKITAAEELAKTKDQEIKNKNQELTDLKSKVPDQIQEMSTLKGDVQSKAKSIADLEEKVKNKEEEINAKHQELTEFKVSAESKDSELSELRGKMRQTEYELKRSRNENIELQETVKQKDNEISNQREQILDCQMNLQKKKIALQGKSDDIDKLKSNLKENQNEIVNLQKEQAKLKGDVQKKPKRIADLETQLRKRDEGIKEANNKVFKLQEALLEKERELILAMQPKSSTKKKR